MYTHMFLQTYMYIYIYIYISVLLCIYMHKGRGSDCEVDSRVFRVKKICIYIHITSVLLCIYMHKSKEDLMLKWML